MPQVASKQSLQHLPVPLFAAVMGLGGTSLAWRRAHLVWGTGQWVQYVFLALAVSALVVLGLAYVTKWVKYPAAASAEVHHPIRLAFLPTITIALLVVATAAQDVHAGAATLLWWVGAVGHLAATVWVLSQWSTRADIGAGHVTPAWFIPVVGNVVTPLGAPTIGNVDLGWFAFGVGVVFWIALLPLVLQRVLTHDAVFWPALRPTWAIFAAPPAVTLLSWQSLTGDADSPVVRVLYAATVMFVILVAAQWRRLRQVPFGVPYWAYLFPVAAAATAALAVAGERPLWTYEVVAGVLLAAATLAAAGVLAATLVRLARGRLLLPEG